KVSTAIFWLLVTTLFIGFSIARAPLLHPTIREDQLAPGEWVHYQTSERSGMLQVAFVVHLVPALVYGVVGAGQFVPGIRKWMINYHRWAGRVYLLCIVIFSVGAAMLGRDSFGGDYSIQAGVYSLIVFVVFSGVMAYIKIRNKEIQRHREWMLRNYAAGMSIVTSRLFLFTLAAITPTVKHLHQSIPCKEMVWFVNNNVTLLQEYCNIIPSSLEAITSQNATSTGPGLIINDLTRFYNEIDFTNEYTAVKAAFPSRRFAENVAAFRVSFGSGVWLAIATHMVLVELWIFWMYYRKPWSAQAVSSKEKGAEKGATSDIVPGPAAV
ncbi:hypothetical protein HK102_003685, partial [Quaeritorhiza haematococci]